MELLNKIFSFSDTLSVTKLTYLITANHVSFYNQSSDPCDKRFPEQGQPI